MRSPELIVRDLGRTVKLLHNGVVLTALPQAGVLGAGVSRLVGTSADETCLVVVGDLGPFRDRGRAGTVGHAQGIKVAVVNVATAAEVARYANGINRGTVAMGTLVSSPMVAAVVAGVKGALVVQGVHLLAVAVVAGVVGQHLPQLTPGRVQGRVPGRGMALERRTQRRSNTIAPL